MASVCRQCGGKLNRYHQGNLCYVCKEKRLEEVVTDDEDLIDAEALAHILGLASAESVKRLARKGKLPPRIPGIKRWLWRRSVVEEWIKQGGFGNKEFRTVARGLASNLRRCSNDPAIYAPSDTKTIGNKVYGKEYIWGTTFAGRIEPITLVEVDSNIALRMLEQLPKKDFPELIGITDWADLPYDRITEDFIVRLESYY
jgi:hypothetical protein